MTEFVNSRISWDRFQTVLIYFIFLSVSDSRREENHDGQRCLTLPEKDESCDKVYGI